MRTLSPKKRWMNLTTPETRRGFDRVGEKQIIKAAYLVGNRRLLDLCADELLQADAVKNGQVLLFDLRMPNLYIEGPAHMVKELAIKHDGIREVLLMQCRPDSARRLKGDLAALNS